MIKVIKEMLPWCVVGGYDTDYILNYILCWTIPIELILKTKCKIWSFLINTINAND